MQELIKFKLLIKKDPIIQLKASELSIIDLFKDLLNEIKGFKYQIILNILLSKVKSSDSIKYSPVYFNSTTKIVINSNKFGLHQSFQEILYKIDNWINEGSGWIIEEMHNQYLNVSVYSPLIGSAYIELPNELKHPKKGWLTFKMVIINVFYSVMLDIKILLIKIHKEKQKKIKNLLIN